MPTPSNPAKAALRARIRAVVAAVPDREWFEASRAVSRRLLALPAVGAARVIMLYCPTGGEVDIRPVIEECWARGLRVAFPRVDWEKGGMEAALVAGWGDLEPTRHGLMQPGIKCDRIPTDLVDVIVAPGVAFDAQGGRLGRGGGFYDGFLAQERARMGRLVVGVCLDEQVVEKVPMDEHDVRVQVLVTPSKAMECDARA